MKVFNAERPMTKFFHTATAFLSIALALQVATAAAAETAENTNLKVQIGNVYTKNNDKNEPLSLTAKNTILRGKRIYIPLTVENYGVTKSEPVKLQYTERSEKKGEQIEPRPYRVPSLEPGKKYQLVLTARFNESGKKEMKAFLTTLEGKPLVDEKGRPRPDTSQTQTVTLEMRD
jgi:hypothetical protein